jgi:hypothetical protein
MCTLTHLADDRMQAILRPCQSEDFHMLMKRLEAVLRVGRQKRGHADIRFLAASGMFLAFLCMGHEGPFPNPSGINLADLLCI